MKTLRQLYASVWVAAAIALGVFIVADRDSSSQIVSYSLGSAAFFNTGVSGATVPVLNGSATTWAASLTSTQFFGGVQTCAAPSISGSGDTQTGVAINNDNSLRFCSNGSEMGRFLNAGDAAFYIGLAASRGGVKVSGTVPTLTSCGTTPAIVGTELAMEVTEGTTATGCTVTFPRTYANAPMCVISAQDPTIPPTVTVLNTTTLTWTNSSSSSKKFDAVCFVR